jgi:hypothetical protein
MEKLQNAGLTALSVTIVILLTYIARTKWILKQRIVRRFFGWTEAKLLFSESNPKLHHETTTTVSISDGCNASTDGYIER